ncbi:MAG: alpha/beta hydrolase [Candidatus Margulisbacteria bacterium]|nr:alpha/beta hydrolase [Candidatus Margulisiibacteriota bacterium]MBU1616492.1 alpha/beta hydrolase [Candidatus Margulisiibacteriota bacterium]
MEIVYLHGFAIGPGIWEGQAAGLTPELCFEDLSLEARRLAEMLPAECCLVGWSMGGMLAIKTALLAPAKVASLVLVSTTPRFLNNESYTSGLPPALLKRLAKKIKDHGLDPFYELVFKDRGGVAQLNLPRDSAMKELAELAQIDLRDEAGELRLPTLIVHGCDDEICLPAAADFFDQTIPESRLAMLKGVGHVPQVEAPEELRRLIAGFVNE